MLERRRVLSLWFGELLISRYSPVTNHLGAAVFREMAEAIADRHGITVDMMLSNRRGVERIVHARQHLMWCLHEEGYSSTSIGRRIGRDHATVLYGIRQHERRQHAAGHVCSQG